MPIWVDADACPIPVKEILYRAAHRARVVTSLPASMTQEARGMSPVITRSPGVTCWAMT